MKRILIVSFLVLSVFPLGLLEAKTVIKFATLAPKGSSWDKIITDYNNAIKLQTGGEVEFSIYPGGVMGDEVDVVKKMKINQIQAAGFTGVGLGTIAPLVRVMESPMIFNDSAQVDKAFEKVGPELEQMLSDKDFVLLGWAHPGLVKILSNAPIKNRKDMDGRKMWIWQGDPIAVAMTEVLKVHPHALPLPDVLTSLQTGLIDSVYCPPLACIALQWHTKTKYITDVNLVHSMGGMVIRKQTFNSLKPEHRKIMKDLGAEYLKKLTLQTRDENDQAFKAMQAAGMKVVKPSDEDMKELKSSAREVWNHLIGKLYTSELLEKVKSSIQ